MRKIKITALILAVLMVMAAFAGCVSTEDVDALDDRVSAIEDKIDANQQQISDLAALIEALTKSQDDIKDSVEANKTAQDASNQAILDAIKDLTDKVGKVENDNKTDATATAELQAAQIAAQTQLATLEANYLAKKDEYTAEDYAKITEIIALAKINVDGAANKAAVEAIVPAALKSLEAYTQVNDGIYNIYLALKNSIVDNDATKEAVKAAKKALAAAKTHYGTEEDGSVSKKLTAYVTVKAADPDDNITMNLVAAIDALVAAYEGDATATNIEFYNEAGKKVTYRTLAWVKAEAKTITDAIKVAAKDVTLASAKVTAINDLVAQYKAWATFAELLAPANVALVTNKADLDTASATVKRLVNAQNAYKTLGEYNATIAGYESIFADYYRAIAAKGGMAYIHTNANIYKAIDTALNAWAKEYSLTAAEIAYIVDNTEMFWVNAAGDKQTNTSIGNTTKIYQANKSDSNTKNKSFTSVSYDGYVANRVKCEALTAKYNTFMSDIVPQIKAMNKITALSNEAFQNMTGIATQINNWMKFTADVTYTVPTTGKTAIALKKDGTITGSYTTYSWQTMLQKSGLVAEDFAHTTPAADISASNYLMLYNFEKPEFTTFFATTYNTAAKIAQVINYQIAEYKDADGNVLNTPIDWTKELSIKKYFDLEGRYVLGSDGKYTVATADQLKASVEAWKSGDAYVDVTTILGEEITIAKFETVYKNADFDLTTALINYTALEAAKANLDAKLAKLATDAAAIVTKSNAILSATDFSAGKLNEKVNLAKEAAVNEAYALYEAWVANSGVFQMQSFGLVANSTTKYEFKAMLTAADTAKLTALKVRIDTLRAEADVLVAAYNALGAMNAYKAFAVDTVKATGAITAFTYVKKNSTGVYYVADAAKVLKAVNWTETTKENSDAALAILVEAAKNYTQFKAIEDVAVAYATFTANNNNATYAAVETAKAACDAYVLLAKKAVAYANVKALIEEGVDGAAPVVTDLAQKALVATTLKTIAAANDLAIVASAIENLVNDLAAQGNNVYVAACSFATDIEFIGAFGTAPSVQNPIAE